MIVVTWLLCANHVVFSLLANHVVFSLLRACAESARHTTKRCTALHRQYSTCVVVNEVRTYYGRDLPLIAHAMTFK